MSSAVSSVFSTSQISDSYKFADDVNLYELFSQSRPNTNAPILAAAFNNCYQKALLSFNESIENLDKQVFLSVKYISKFNISEDDFDTTTLSQDSTTPKSIRTCIWRHEQFLNKKFIPKLIPIVAENMYPIVLHWIELELKNEEDRESKNEKNKKDLKDKLFTLKSMEKSIDIDKLYELSGSYKDVLIEQVDWKTVAKIMRRNGGFKYFDEYSLQRMWKHRCQYGINSVWSDEEDETLNQLVEQLGYGKWTEIAQHEIFQKKKKSAYMCAQRYMSKSNREYSRRLLTKDEKDSLLSLHKHRCSIAKDYRFGVSYAAYTLGDRCIREITHAWTYINPDIQRGSFTEKEDAIILEYATKNSSKYWTKFVAKYLPNRSACHCRKRYIQLLKNQLTAQTNKKTKRKKSRPAPVIVLNEDHDEVQIGTNQ